MDTTVLIAKNVVARYSVTISGVKVSIVDLHRVSLVETALLSKTLSDGQGNIMVTTDGRTYLGNNKKYDPAAENNDPALRRLWVAAEVSKVRSA